MIGDRDLEKYQCYILYGKDEEDLIRRIVAYIGDCAKVVFSKDIPTASKVCSNPRFEDIENEEKLRSLIESTPQGYFLVFRTTSPRRDVYAIVMLPINEFNKKVVGGGKLRG